MRLKSIKIFIMMLCAVSLIYSQNDYKKWLKKEQEKFNKFLSEEDKKFSEFLEKEWKQYQLHSGIKKDTTPKPIDAPVYKSLKEETGKTQIEIEPEIKKQRIEVPQNNTLNFFEEETNKFETKSESRKNLESFKEIEEPLKTESPSPSLGQIPNLDISQLPVLKNIPFCGIKKQFRYPKEFNIKMQEQLDNKSVADYWRSISSKYYQGILEQAKYYKNAMNLNDWGYIQFLKKIAEGIYSNQRNEKHLFVWFFLIKTGYNVKAGIMGNQVFIFFPSVHKIYEISFFRTTDKGSVHYILDLDNLKNSGSGYLYTYEQNYPGTDKSLDMRILEFPNVSDKYNNKKLAWRSNQENYEINVQYNDGFIEYVKEYPYSDLTIYFNSTASPKFHSTIHSQLNKIINGKSEKEAVDILLAFVQNSFKYKTDQQQFGREKPLFLEETVHYPFSDCEDRAAIFSFLIKNLTGLEVVGVDYPGHVAVAVKFSNYSDGRKILYQGDEFTICDPTFMSATAGFEMPEYYNVNKNIIEIE